MLKKVGAAWVNAEKGYIRIVMSQGQTLEYGVRAYLFPAKEKKSDRSPDYNLCIRTDDDDDQPKKVKDEDIPF